MANLKARDADSAPKFVKASGSGTDADPLIIEHSDQAVLAELARLTEIREKLIEAPATEETLALVKDAIDDLVTAIGASSTPTDPATAANQTEQITALEQISERIGDLKTYTDNLETLATALSGFVDSLEGYLDAVEPKLDTLLTKFPTALSNDRLKTEAIVSTASGVPVSVNDTISSSVEFSTAFGANQSLLGASRDTNGIRNKVRGWVFTDAMGTLTVEQSVDNSIFRQTHAFVITGSTQQATIFEFDLIGRWFKLRYTNGATAQTVLQVIRTMVNIGA